MKLTQDLKDLFSIFKTECILRVCGYRTNRPYAGTYIYCQIHYDQNDRMILYIDCAKNIELTYTFDAFKST